MFLLAFDEALPEIPEVNPDVVWMLKIALGIYVLILLGVSIVSAKKVENEEDYLIAGRRLPLFLAWGTLMATWFGAATMFAAAEASRNEGLLGVVLDPFACSITLVFAGIFFARPLWRMNLMTMGDFYRKIYGPRAEFVASSIQVPGYFGWIALQYTALAEIQSTYFGIDPFYGRIYAAVLTLIYTLIGGMWSVTLTDTMQIVVALIGLVLLAAAVFADPLLGDGESIRGVGVLIDTLNEHHPGHLSLIPAGGAIVIMGWIGSWMTGLFGNIPGQDLQQRVFASKSANTAMYACILAGGLYLLFGLFPVGIGLASKITHPEIEVQPVAFMAAHYLSPPVLVIFIVAVVSMVVSTATSAVLAPATLLGHNILSRVPAWKNAGLARDRACVVIVSCGGLALSMMGQGMMELLDLALSIQLVALFVPVAMGIYGRPRGELSAVLATSFGFCAWLTKFGIEKFQESAEATVDMAEAVVDMAEPAASGLMQTMNDIPSDFYGFGFSVFGYFMGQYLCRNNPPRATDDAQAG